MIEYLEHVACELHARYARTSPYDVLPVVNGHLRAITKHLSVSQPVSCRRRLCSVAGHFAGLKAWLCFDLARADLAEQWYPLALQSAEEADNDALAAWLLGAHSVTAFDQHNIDKAMQLLDRAHLHASRASAAPVSGWIDALTARAHAAHGNADRARASLDRVQRRTFAIDTETRLHGMDVRDGELNVDYYEGESLLALREPGAARAVFQRAITAQGQDNIKGRTVVTLQLALAHAAQRDVDHAVELAISACEIPEDQWIKPIAARIERLRRMVQPMTSPALSERLAELQSRTEFHV